MSYDLTTLLIAANCFVALVAYMAYTKMSHRVSDLIDINDETIDNLRKDLIIANERVKQISDEFRMAMEQVNEKHAREMAELLKRESDRYQSLAERRNTEAVENAAHTIERTFKGMSKALEGEFLSSFKILQGMISKGSNDDIKFKTAMSEDEEVQIWN